MLYPQANAVRTVQALPAIWDFRLEKTDKWQPIAVPAAPSGRQGYNRANAKKRG